jgi:3-hydroxyisobutyrate dehydrogenase-like beta-hydroxyacid dehydrogenase
MRDVGFIGAGRMGGAMVRSLLRAGHAVTVWNRTPAKAAPLADAGATIAPTIAEACRGGVVFTMLADDAAACEVISGAHGVMDSLAPQQTVHVSGSTISPTLVRELAARHRERNLAFVSAPVLGRPEAAEEGKLVALVAGEARWIDAVRPALDAIAQRTFAVADAPEAANVVKLACNAITASLIESLGETLALVGKTRLVAPGRLIEVLLGTVLAAPNFRPYGEHVRDDQFEPGFAVPLALKDIELALGVAHDHAVPMPVVSVVRDHLLEAIAKGYGDLDWSALTLLARQDAGIRPHA